MTDSHEWRNTFVAVSPDVELSMGELVDAWDAHVQRIVAELGAKPSDRTTWGAYDLVAALHLRDAVERGLQALEQSVRLAVQDVVAAIDQKFVDNTEEDRGALLATYVVADQMSIDAWWWHRVPVHGPIRFELSGESGAS